MVDPLVVGGDLPPFLAIFGTTNKPLDTTYV